MTSSAPRRFGAPGTETWDFPRRVAGTALLVAEGESAGIDLATLLAGTGLGVRDLDDHHREVTAAQELRVVRNLGREAAPGAAVRVGSRYHASTFGPLGLALMSAPSLGAAAEVALRYLDLSFVFTLPDFVVHEPADDGTITLEGSPSRLGPLDHAVVALHLDDRDLADDVRRFVVERDLAAFWTVLRELAGGRPRLRAVRLPFAPRETEAYRETFGVPPTWITGGRAALVLDASWLDQPLPQSNSHAFAMAQELCADLVADRRARDGVVPQVRVLVAQHLEDGAPMAAVAAHLGLSERSLRRRLADAGVSFREVVDGVRHERADDLLTRTDLEVAEIALRLGYAESTSFSAAYRRWTGTTPARARAAARAARGLD
ncbi:AraC family transcriptional regulator [Nocardioides sp.]|uniref:AraC family transcriptional regulator n=1 Tax=Nocardioides sp. TaxID=35761 RepID=UPI0035161CA4